MRFSASVATISKLLPRLRLWRTGAIGLMVLVGACSLPQRSPDSANTLASSHKIPGSWVKRAITSEKWAVWSDRPFTAYAVLDGVIESNGFVTVHVSQFFPDNSRDLLALEFSTSVQLKAVALVGSRLVPRAEVYVVFYENDVQREALVFGRQREPTAAVRSRMETKTCIWKANSTRVVTPAHLRGLTSGFNLAEKRKPGRLARRQVERR